MRIKFIQNFIDIIRSKTKTHDIRYFHKIQKTVENRIAFLKNKKNNGSKIKVAFLFMYATDCQNLSIFDKMLEDNSIFDPYFIINPDVLRSKDNFDYNYKRSKNELIKKYGSDRVLDGYDYNNDTFIDFTSNFDIATTNNPYDNMAHDFFKISYWAKKSIPIFYISYFYMGRCFVSIDNLKSEAFSYIWKIFVENNYVKKLAQEYEIIKGKNIVVAGSPKMDKLASIVPKNKSRKMIIIAPHHAIDNNEKSVGGFLQYCDILLQLPEKYKDIDFIFRPHPLLFENLRKKYWGKEKSDKYLNELLSKDNVTYSTEGEYMEMFSNSDALIHDCGSFCAEYLYTGKPCAYLYKQGLNPDAIWTDFGKKCIDSHYLIKEPNEIEKFIDDVVINENDYLKDTRNEFVENVITVNYPTCSDYIMNKLIEVFK